MKTYIVNMFIIGILFLISGCKNEDEKFINDFFYLRNEGADMPVYVEGTNKSNLFIILLHGGPGGDCHTYNGGISYFSDQLEEDLVMVYYDQRGSGISMGKYSSQDLTLDQYMKDLDLLVNLVFEFYGPDISLFLMGHSWGGTLGTAYLTHMNGDDRIKGWIEIDGVHSGEESNNINRLKEIGDEQIGLGNSSEFWQEVIDYCNEIDTNDITDIQISKLNNYAYEAESHLISDKVIVLESNNITLQTYIGGIVKHYFFSSYNPLTAWTNGKITSSGLGMFNEVMSIDLTGDLKKITIPALILWGKYDLVVPVNNGEFTFKNIGTDSLMKKLVIYEKSGHSPMMTEPDKVAREIFNFTNTFR
ncbi:MAG: alpha/beta hydrolase [Bacteroidales bacterium]|nr:alpha/beta hydrolase [Bacteroidales bacterium]